MYSYAQIEKMIKRQESKYGWQFLFLGANIDSAKEGARLGLKRKHTANYVQDSKGTVCFFKSLDKAISKIRECGELEEDWAMDINEDYKKRG